MTQAETAKIIFILKELYPHSTENTTIENRIKAWHMILRDYTYDETQKAVVAFARADSKGFFPAVGQIIAEIEKAQSGAFMSLDSDYENRVLSYLNERRLLE